MVVPGIKADLEEKQTGTKSCRFMGKPGTTDWNWKSTLQQESEQPEAEIKLERGRTTAKDRRSEEGSSPIHLGTQFTNQFYMPRPPASPEQAAGP